MNKIVNENIQKQILKYTKKPENPCGCIRTHIYVYKTNTNVCLNGRRYINIANFYFEFAVAFLYVLCKFNNMNRGMRIPLILMGKKPNKISLV